MHIEAVGGGAGFAAVAHLGQHGAVQRVVQIGVLADDEGGVAAQFHGAGNHLVGGFMQQCAPHRRRTGEGNLAHTRIMQHCLGQRAGLAGGDDVDHTRRHAAVMHDLRDSKGGERGFGGGLQHHGAARRQGGRDLAGGHRRRIIPGRDQQRDAHGLVLHQDARAASRGQGDLAQHMTAFFRVPAIEFGGIQHFGARVGQRLAVFQADQIGQPFDILDDLLIALAQDFGAEARRLPALDGSLLAERPRLDGAGQAADSGQVIRPRHPCRAARNRSPAAGNAPPPPLR